MDLQTSESSVIDAGVTTEPVVEESDSHDENLELLQPRQVINKLGLTSEYNFYGRFGPKTIYSRQQLAWNDYDSGKAVNGGYVTWTLDTYVYAFGARLYIQDASGKSVKNRNFGNEGGQMLWILVHGGYFEIQDTRGPHIEYIATIEGPSGSGTANDQLPRSNSWEKDGDTYRYSIEYGNRLDMYKNGGNQIENVDISYQETYSYLKMKQNVERLDQKSIGLSLRADDTRPKGTQLQLHGLTIFRTTDVVDTRWFWPKVGIRGNYTTNPKVVTKFASLGSINVNFKDLNNLPY